MNFGTSKPINNNNSASEIGNSIDSSRINIPQEQQILQNINRLDGYFTENRGQVEDDSVRYCIQGKGVWFLEDGVVFKIQEPCGVQSPGSGGPEPIDPFNNLHPEFEPEMPPPRKSVVIKLNFEGCNEVVPIGMGLLPHRSNFFYGQDPSIWYTEVPNFQEIVYENIYDDIDLRYYSSDYGLKYDFIVHPGGNPNEILLGYDGADALEIDIDGNLLIRTSLGDIIEANPFIYQPLPAKEIAGSFKLLSSMTFGFEIYDEYQEDQVLVIDPLLFSTYLGGSDVEHAYDSAIDANGDIYLTGYTESPEFPTTPNAYNTVSNGGADIYVTKLDGDDSTAKYSTFIGSTASEYAHAIAVDSNGNAYVSGNGGTDFPITPGAYDTTFNGGGDVILFKLDPMGSNLLYSTFIGGSMGEWCYGIAVDENDNVYLTGGTGSDDFPTTQDVFDDTHNSPFSGTDVFVLKLNLSTSFLKYSTYIGGDDWDSSMGVIVDENGNAYVGGLTDSDNFPTTLGAFDTSHNGGYDAIVFKLNPTASTLLYSTFIGGNGDDQCYDIAVDSYGDIYGAGWTGSANLPTKFDSFDVNLGGVTDGFVFRINPAGTSSGDLVYSTYIGSSLADRAHDITIDSMGNAYVTGVSFGDDFPTTPDAYDSTYNGVSGGDIYIARFNPLGNDLIYSTYVGGTNWEEGNNILLNPSINVTVTGFTYSNDFPMTTNSYDNSHNGWVDVVAFKLNLNAHPIINDLKISQPSITRTNTIYLYANATDVDSSESKLTPTFEFRDPTDTVWRTDWLNSPTYVYDHWQVSFMPPTYAELGLYDFRVRFNDQGKLYTPWLYANESLMVLNNIPLIESIALSTALIFRNENLKIFINCSDIETQASNLAFELYYKCMTDTEWDNDYLSAVSYLQNRWESTMAIPITAPVGKYSFKVRVQDSDQDYSEWLYNNESLTVKNNPPAVIDIKYSADKVLRTDSIFIYVNGSDIETSEGKLQFAAQYKTKDSSWTDLAGYYSSLNNNWETEFVTTKASILGYYNFRFKFQDYESDECHWLYLNSSLQVLNNAPVIENITLTQTSIYRTDTILIDIDVNDNEDSAKQLVCEIRIRPAKGDWVELHSIAYNVDHWEVHFTPSRTAELGSYDMKINFTDLDEGCCGWTLNEDIIEVKNNPPVIDEDCDEFNLGLDPMDIDLSQYGSDIEDKSRDLKWSLDPTSADKTLFSASISDEVTLTLTSYHNVTGSDDITLILKDKDDGTTINTNVTVHVDTKSYYQVSLTTSQVLLQMAQGSTKTLILTVTNEGILEDSYVINFQSNDFGVNDILFDINEIFLKSGQDAQITVQINVPKGLALDYYTIVFTAKSPNQYDNTSLLLEVTEKSATGDTDGSEDYTMVYTGIGIVIIIAIVIFILVFVFVIRKKRQPQLPPGKVEPVEKVQPPPPEEVPPEVPPEQPPPPEVTPQVVPQVEAAPESTPIPQTVQQPAPQPQVKLQPQGQAPVPKIKDPQ